MFVSPRGFAERKMPSSLQSIAYPRGQEAMGSSVPPMRYAEGRYIPPLALVFRALTPVLGVLTPVVDDPSSGAMPSQNCADWAMQHSDCRWLSPDCQEARRSFAVQERRGRRGQ